jgi:hypothetical protein
MPKKKYIPISEIWKETYSRPPVAISFTLVEKVPITEIKIDKRLFSWQNKVDKSQVDFIIKNFDQDFWMPILVNRCYFLLDGQHRLRVAKRMGLEFIDVVIDKENRAFLYSSKIGGFCLHNIAIYSLTLCF